MWAELPLIPQFNTEISPTIDAQTCVNFYHVMSPQGKKKNAAVGFAGIRKKYTLPDTENPDDPVRGLIEFDGILYAVGGNKFYAISNDDTIDSLGDLQTFAGLASMAANNGNQIIIVDGSSTGYIYNVGSGTFIEISSVSPDFPEKATMVSFLDGYFIVAVAESRQFYISALNDGTKWDILDFAVTQATPGELIGCAVVGRRLFLFKRDSVEVWWNAGEADFPLRRDNNLLFDFGCAASGSIVADLGILFWLSADKSGASSILMSSGGRPERISTPAVENLIRSFDVVEDARAYLYKNDDGKLFYIISFTDAQTTLYYNLDLKTWGTLETVTNPTPSSPFAGNKRHPGDCHAFFKNTNYIGSYNSPVIYAMSSDYSDNDGIPIKREITLPPFFDPTYRSIQLQELEIDMQVGVGNVTGIYRYPRVYLSVSRDDGLTFGNQHPLPIGAIGQRSNRVVWRRLGTLIGKRSAVFRLTVYADVMPVIIKGVALRYEGLRK